MKLLKFAENLKIALHDKKMTQQDLANLVGTTQATVNRWLKGINEPDLTVLLEICLYLDETPNALLGYDDITEQDFLAYQQNPENYSFEYKHGNTVLKHCEKNYTKTKEKDL